jgi:PAS domain-containing protein
MHPASLAPCEWNGYLQDHAMRLLASLRHWTGRSLVDPTRSESAQARELYHASFAVLSHNSEADPLLNYANQAALTLFELSWDELIVTPSRLTAEAPHRDRRARLLAEVTAQGFIDDYRGVRISKNGRRFEIERATVWTVLDKHGICCGQAATFCDWRFLNQQDEGS